MHFGKRLRELREGKQLLQRQLAASLEIDTPMLSKIERGERKAKREQVVALAALLETDKDALLALWLADQIVDLINDDAMAIKAIRLAEEYFSKLGN